MRLHVIVFSKDRPLQLDATLRSLRATCAAPDAVQVKVIHVASTPRLAELYARVAAENPWAELVPERGFRETLLAAARGAGLLGFVVDDCLFVRPWDPAPIAAVLASHAEVIGASLRLGRNTAHCYMLDRPQRVPPLLPLGGGLLALEWPVAEHDFGYPLELSSSLYRASDLVPLLERLPYRNPNELELALATVAREAFATTRPVLLCPERSAAFCAPLNVVQTTFANRNGARPEHSPEALADRYERGERIDVDALRGYTPRACHEELALPFTGGAATPAEPGRPVRIGFLVIATQKYVDLFPPLRRSIREHLRVPGADVRFFCFTDRELAPEPDTTVFRVDHLPWPLVTLLRYRFFAARRAELAAMDYLLYVDADMRFVAPVGPEVLGDRVCVRHPGFHAAPRSRFTYERDPRSAACVPDDRGTHYFQNCFQGGRSDLFLEMASELEDAINGDLKKNVIAVWHDESHMNRYMIDHPPDRILDPGYAYPEGWSLPFAPRIMGVSKDHAAIRAEERAAPITVMEHSLVVPPDGRGLQVVDLGFSLGEFAEGLIAAVGTQRIGRYLGVEASSALFERARARFAGLEFLSLEHAAVSDADGRTVTFAEDTRSPYNGNALAAARPAFDHFSTTRRNVEVTTISLDAILSRFEYVDVLKVDIEGSEIAAFEAASPGLLSRVRQITCEFHDFVDPSLRPSVERVVKKLQTEGFEVRRVVPTDYMHGSRWYDTHFVNTRFAAC